MVEPGACESVISPAISCFSFSINPTFFSAQREISAEISRHWIEMPSGIENPIKKLAKIAF